MRSFFILSITLTIPFFFYSQTTQLNISYKENLYQVSVKEFHDNFYFSFSDFCNQLSIPHYPGKNSLTIESEFEIGQLSVNPGHPFLVFKNKFDSHSKIFQMPVSVFTDEKDVFIPVKYSIETLSDAFGKEIYLKDSLTLVISEKDISKSNLSSLKVFENREVKSSISEILIYEKGDGIEVKLFPSRKIQSYRTIYNPGEFKIILSNTDIVTEPNITVQTDLVNDVNSIIKNNNLEVIVNINFDYYFSDITELIPTNGIIVRINVMPDPTDWFKTESDHFTVVYRESHSSLIPYIIHSAENSLKVLMRLFDYTPSEKIILNIYDVSDYGFGATTTIPQNYMRIEIEPLEPGYENTPYNERLQWLINHELVHIVVNDQASSIENISRKVFQKVAPEQVQPISVFYSILTNYSRYTPRWHQEALAVFLETWMSGGFGRILGNFDEMYFRTKVLDNKEFPSDIKLDAKVTHNSFLTEILFYLYGGRFAAYLSIKYDAQKFFEWFKISSGDFYHDFKNKFEIIFGQDFDDEWDNFIAFEKEFQKKNIEKLNSSKTTYVKRLKPEPVGFTTQPHYDPISGSVLFGYHKPHHLSSILKLDLKSFRTADIGTLETPSQIQVSSTAFDYETGLFFYTTNNNQLYRDVNVLNVETGETKTIFKDSRIGNLAISALTHELWGIKHSGGKAAIVYSPYPYNILQQLTEFSVGEEIQQLAVDPTGKYLAATLLTTDGQQSIIIISTDSLLKASGFQITIITSKGSPENPSWSRDGKYLYWNAFTNGVSNIYKVGFGPGLTSGFSPVALTHTLRGLFKPIQIDNELLFAFEFTSEGLIPVIIPDSPAGLLPAINYLGQEVIKKNSGMYNLYVTPVEETSSLKIINEEEKYNGIKNLKIQTFIPVISGFQKQKMLGIFAHISDPLLIHDLTIETGYSPFNENPVGPKWHFRGKYEFKKKWQLGIEHNAPDFYDLFNKRKRGLIGSKFLLSNTHYWVYDNPLKIKQQSEIAYYTNLIFINDNLVRVSEPDFAVVQTNFNSRNLRKTIGSSDFEYGNEYDITLMIFGTRTESMEYLGQIYGEWDHFTTFFFDHNVFHLKLAAGYLNDNDKLFQGRFFFGGFGNRALENVDVKQYRKVFRFPGIPIYSLDADKFVKLMIENNLPPLRFGNAALGNHFLNHIDFAIYSQALYTKSPLGEKWIDLGAQINFVIKHWFNLESTISAGIANAWYEGGENWEWFISFKLLKN